MKKFFYILIVFVLSACGINQTPTQPVPTSVPTSAPTSEWTVNDVVVTNGCVKNGSMVIGLRYSFQQVDEGYGVVATEVIIVAELDTIGMVSVKEVEESTLNLQPQGYVNGIFMHYTEDGEPIVEVDGKLYLVKYSCKQKLD